MKRLLSLLGIIAFFGILAGWRPVFSEVASTYSYIPPFLTNAIPPMVMLTMARDHRLYYEAYNDASDINEDGQLDIRYNPSIDYYGYFDSYKYYAFNSTSDRFEPRGITANKKSPDGAYWSGDFLNYVSMTRMDCLRKVLYGGFRSTDTATETVLERAYIPQDAHSFGKEYDSIAYDGFDIREYTPLDLPQSGTRHLIATTAVGQDGKPLLRVLTDSTARIWEWVAIERPVVTGNIGGSTTHPGHPGNHAEFDTMVSTYGTASRQFNTGPRTQINYPTSGTSGTSGNPYGSDDNYLNIFTGTLVIREAGTYRFAIDGDGAVEFRIAGATWSSPSGVVITNDVIGWYGAHTASGSTNRNAEVYLAAGSYTIEFRHEEETGSEAYKLFWRRPGSYTYQLVPQWTTSSLRGLRDLTQSTYNLVTAAVLTDYTLRVKVGVAGMPESNCKLYPNGTYKPVGVLQRHGESDRMYFGLMTGSYSKNLSGGVLRQPIGSIRQEINSSSGEFLYMDNSTVGGIVKTLDKLKIHGFNNYDTGNGNTKWVYAEDCGWIVNTPLTEGKCRMWGNPMAEMMYETVRYFSGAGTPTPQFLYSSSNSSADDNQLGLPLATWNNPYNSTNYCSKPIMVAISDIFPSYDSDQLPGSAWPSTLGTTLSGLHADNGVQAIANHEGLNGTFYIGQNNAPGTDGYDGACTPKSIPGLEKIRGLCPEEPSKQGSYYSSAVTHYAATTNLLSLNPNSDIQALSANSTQTMASYMVALSSPLPEIRIPVAGKVITMVPFAKSPGGGAYSQNISPTGNFQPTNTIVDFFVEELNATAGTFRVNFEDVEQGADHDMDAIARYHYEVETNGTVTITVTSEYAAGSIQQHMGYIISGTTADRTYLVVRDEDTDDDDDVDYHLDVPNTSAALPLSSTRNFTPGTTEAASLLKNPLWYAAKWGGFEDGNNNGIPDILGEWDKNTDGVPDTYFYVANPTRLEEQLNKAFADILRRTASGTAASVISQSREGEGAVYQSIFYPEFKDSFGHTLNWAGQAHALLVDSRGNIREDTNGNSQLDPASDKIIVYGDAAIYRYRDWNGDNVLTESEKSNSTEVLNSPQEVNFLWSSSAWLNNIADGDVVTQRNAYNATTANRYIFTFADKDNDMLVDNGEMQTFAWPPANIDGTSLTVNANLGNSTDFYAYLTLYPSFSDTPSNINSLRSSDPTGFASLLTELARRQIDYIRGADQNATTIAGYALNATRSRVYAEDNTATLTWRLGDVVYSTPTVVGKPAENYNLIYLDRSYENFLQQYRNRRQMVYVGANDGMLHAFNGGFYNSTRKGFDRQHSGETNFPLGMEMWAYVPYNLLPHLSWLTDPSYGSQLHVSFMDLKPRVFDARVFFQSDGVTPLDSDHPGGWGTIMVAGMRLGGGKIRADLDKTDGNGFAAIDRTMSSAYVISDITNPEKPPKVLAEIRMPRQGFTTCYPTAMPMAPAPTSEPFTDANNQWYLVFGSGPANALGESDPLLINVDTSMQNGQLFVLDLKSLVKDRALYTVNSSKQLVPGNSTFATTEAGSFISDPIAVDLNIGDETGNEFKTDVVYFGTVAGDQTYSQGKMYRMRTNNSQVQMDWETSTLIDVGQPVTAAPSAAMDEAKQLWVYFGTGRFFNRDDIPQANNMSFFGIREPVDTNNTKTWTTIDAANLYNSSEITLTNGTCPGPVYTPDCVRVYKSGTLLGNWNDLLAEVDAKDGWRQDFTPAYERVLGQASILGGTVLFTSYKPSTNPCEFEGTSNLWALFYKTGTAYYNPIFRNASDLFATFIDLGKGLAMTPNVHVGEKDTSTAFIQTSTGAIITIEIANPFSIKSGSIFWRRN